MGVYQILGGRRLCGTVTVQGSKNAVLPMIAAAVLTKEEVVLEGCPKISDVEDMAEIVRSLGGTVWWERNALHLNCEKIEKSRVEGALSKRLRASLLFLGSLLARTGEAYLAGAGGCRIGKRPTDLHQRAMELLGAEVFEEDGTIRAKADHPKGAVLCFPKKSVGATENAVLFAVGVEGATRLEHCAREPEVVHLCRLLKAMGAEITGEGTEQITVYGRQGKRLLSGCRYRVPGDRIAAGTYLLMGAATVLSYRVLARLVSSNTVACLGSLVAAVIAYAILVLALQCITYEDCMLFPKGEKIAKILHIRRRS